MGIFDDVARAIPSGAGATLAMGMAARHVPGKAGQALKAGMSIGKGFVNGGLAGGVNAVLDSGILTSLFPAMSGSASMLRYWLTPSGLFGGMTPAQAKMIYDEAQAIRYAKKNLWIVQIYDLMPAEFLSAELVTAMRLISGGDPSVFNMFATEVDYGRMSTGDRKAIGSASVDMPTGVEPVELRLSTLDDASGTLKRWFNNKFSTMVRPDGTVGLPKEYLCEIRVVHASITDSFGAYSHSMLARPVNLEIELSRRDDNLEELRMTFTQFDTFMPV